MSFREKISVIGLGKLGLGYALSMVDRGVPVLGVDIQAAVIDALRAGCCPVQEPGYAALVARHTDALDLSLHHADAVTETDISYFFLATPSLEDGRFSNEYLVQAVQALAQALAESDKAEHLFVIASTVMPGVTEQVLIPLIERVSGRTHRQGFHVCVLPEYVALGSVLRNYQYPDLIVIGAASPETGAELEARCRRLARNEPEVFHVSLVDAEIAKISLNAYVTTKISFANMLARLCESIPGADVDSVTRAVGADPRVGRPFFTGGLAFGGPCFPRDTKALAALQAQWGNALTLMPAVDEENALQQTRLRDRVLELAGADSRVAILGLAFKEGTACALASPGLELTALLAGRVARLSVYDPLAMDVLRPEWGDAVCFADSPADCLKEATLCILPNRSAVFADAVYACAGGQELFVLDCWRQLDGSRVPDGIRVEGMGRSRAPVDLTPSASF